MDLVISLESHQEPVASLFNIIILCNLAIYIANTFADLIRLLKLCGFFSRDLEPEHPLSGGQLMLGCKDC